MRFGTYFFLQAPPTLTHAEVFRREIEQMVWTEELGFDSLWLTEHPFIEYGLSVSPAVLAAAAAVRTQRVRIGLAAAILPFHDPVRLAEELAMVDILSGGRLDVGVGRGNRPVEFEGYPVPQIESRERCDESLAIMIGAWTMERFSFAGRHPCDSRGACHSQADPTAASAALRRVRELRDHRGHPSAVAAGVPGDANALRHDHVGTARRRDTGVRLAPHRSAEDGRAA